MDTAITAAPNSVPAIRHRIAADSSAPRWVVAMLLSRIVLFAVFHLAIAGVFALQGSANPMDDTIAWWTVVATLTNVVCIAMLLWLTRLEGIRMRDLLSPSRSSIRRDVFISLALLLVAAPVMLIPNILAGNWLFGDVQLTSAIMFRPLPRWVALVTLVAFPLTIAFAELPTYFGYVRPRLEALTSRPWLALALPVLFLAAQHCLLPMVLDGRYMLWRFLMFLPFALLVGAALRWRPSLFPYMVVIHALLDLQVGVMVLAVS